MATKKNSVTMRDFDDDYDEFDAKAAKREVRRKARMEELKSYDARQQRVYKQSLLWFDIHGAAFLGVSSLLFAMNFLVAVLSRNGTPWSLFVIVGWGGLVLVHFLVTYSLFKYFELPTGELDEYYEVFLEEWNRRAMPLVRRVATGDLFPGGSPLLRAWRLVQPFIPRK